MSKNLTQEEYYELCQKLADHYYDDDADVDYYSMKEKWATIEPEPKLKAMLPDTNGIIDLTDATKSQVLNRINHNNNFKVGKFLLKISKYKGGPETGVVLDIFIYEERKNTTFNKISVKIDPAKDDRFQKLTWAKYFNDGFKIGKNIPINILPNIIKWLQAVQKLAIFL